MCECCGGNYVQKYSSERIKIFKCDGCCTFFAEHFQNSKSEYWNAPSINQEFLDALATRRKIQAKVIIQNAPKKFFGVPTVDYGCGQGLFLKAMLQQGIDAYGCDVHLAKAEGIDQSKIFYVSAWEFPKRDVAITTVCLLDVLEHCNEPKKFLSTLQKAQIENIVCKIPVAFGPLYLVALVLAKFGIGKYLESLFQVGDSAPHVYYFSRLGLEKLFLSAGYALEKTKLVAEVGPELGARLRTSASRKVVLTPIFSVFGFLAEFFSRFWSDSGIFYFIHR